MTTSPFPASRVYKRTWHRCHEVLDGLRAVVTVVQADLVEGFSTGGWLWFQELHKPDPYFILPVVQGVFGVASIHVCAVALGDSWPDCP